MPKKTASGKYRGRVQIGVNPDGTNKNKWVSASSLGELELKKRALREHYVTGVPIREDMPFQEYALEWYRLKKQPRLSDGSQRSYDSCFNCHLLPTFGIRNLRAIRASELQEYVNGYYGKAKSTITLIMGILKGVFTSATGEGIIQINPTWGLVGPLPKKKTKKRALTTEETKGTLKQIETHEHGDILAVLYYLGVRRGECLGLKWGDFLWERNFVHIQRDIDFMSRSDAEGALKTEAADRFIPIPMELRAILYPKRIWPEAYVFSPGGGKPYTESTFSRAWLKLMIEIGCYKERPELKNKKRPDDILSKYQATLTPHYYRHNYITLLYQAKIDPLIAMKLAGHADYQTTANIYTHLDEEMLKQPMCDLEKMFANKKLMAQIQNL